MSVAMDAGRIYASFWQGGFEGADHVNGSGTALCMNGSTGHFIQARADYERLARRGIHTVRESAGWRHIGRGDAFDFERVGACMAAARDAGTQILWTCFHYGMPRGLDLFSADFVPRLADYCAALAEYLRPLHDDALPPVYTPVNEISFLCWAACETGLLHPYVGDRAHEGHALKRHVVRAAIAAADAIRAVDPRARILVVDPLIHVVPAPGANGEEAAHQNEAQYEANDMLCGRRDPDLGGSPRQLDLIGVNYYPHNQWESHTRHTLPWRVDMRRRPFAELLLDLHARYRRPITISETSHVGDQRGPWITDVAEEVRRAIDAGVDIQGICLYPVLDRPDWENPADWHRSGLWRIDPASGARRIDPSYALAIERARRILHPPSTAPPPARRAAISTLSTHW